jgi:IS30 family transposase
MDTVKGKKDTHATILVLTERTTRKEITIKMPDGTTKSTIAALNQLERRFGQLFPKVFKSITVDNGSEFADCEGIEQSALNPNEKRTKIYYCHPYSSYERGSNENQNKLIRRHITKGTPIENYTAAQITQVGVWINNYPRSIFGFETSEQRFMAWIDTLEKDKYECIKDFCCS